MKTLDFGRGNFVMIGKETIYWPGENTDSWFDTICVIVGGVASATYYMFMGLPFSYKSSIRDSEKKFVANDANDILKKISDMPGVIPATVAFVKKFFDVYYYTTFGVVEQCQIQKHLCDSNDDNMALLTESTKATADSCQVLKDIDGNLKILQDINGNLASLNLNVYSGD